ncbi:MAG: TraR/DksA C4-type zinc finger protein [Muribaculaceae bacterium]|nr:TraR/DksA C4-type zinc finger protein [Muribaculaceae bacterium]MBQ2562531.1 TraR/DksA C4-type zinc finger protein [Muribaculaceae bacterium]MBQ5410024.1 TraR/DksA C4-type zinc finger protein [Muribaculaceae bacterium]MDY6293400.1 TraR/DksA C4-type zinc finger protein [Bacteroidales bacterium]MDY6411949.1 TraR/DksA C4-type zinc finger protein [Bacteroidales bacterium]
MATEQEKTRYSDEELQEFKTLILEKIEVAKKSYEQLMAKLQADESRNSFNMLEEGANTQEQEEASQRAARQQDFIKKLQAALVRIENKTYGVCRVTGKLIPKGRLLAVPHATLSVEGKEIEQQRKKQ